MQISIWEKESFFAPCDVAIVGGGFTGLWSAYFLKKQQPDLRVTIIERGFIPYGASTRNAGFACYGSPTELLYDAQHMGEDKMLSLVEMRYKGLETIQSVFGQQKIGYENLGGYELINKVESGFEDQLQHLNHLLTPVLGNKSLFSFADHKIDEFGFIGVKHLLFTPAEGQLHSGKLCLSLMQTVQSMGVTIVPATSIESYESLKDHVEVNTPHFTLKASKLLITTNAFARQLLPGINIVPARGQVLITDELPDLKIKGTFHFDGGFYYFRNLGKRLLLGGARNTAIDQEATEVMETTTFIQEKLERFINDHLLPETSFRITDRWSGIMGMGEEKMPVVQQLNDHVYCAVRMSGMGVALAPIVGEQMSKMILN